MPGPAKPRGLSRQNELDLTKLDESLDDVPEEATLGKLQSALEVLLSERSHPMIVELSKQLERLKNAEALIDRELEVRGKRRRQNNVDDGNDLGLHTTHDPSDIATTDVDMTRGEGQEISSSTGTGDRIDNDDDDNEKQAPHKVQSASDEDGHAANKDTEAAEPKSTTSASSKRKRSASSDEEPDSLDAQAKAAASVLTNKAKPSLIENDIKAEHERNRAGKATPGSHVHVEDGNTLGPGSERSAGNQKFVANPKSEFVPTQALPTHTLGLFDENDDGEDEDAYKRKLGVVSYPKEDLSTLVAGPVPMDDFTRAKPANQVQWSTYATFLEPYFRQFTDEDIQFLQQVTVGGGIEAANLRGGRKLSPYTLPPLGPWYHQQWAQQDAEIAGTDVSLAVKKAMASEPHMQASELTKIYQPAGTVQDIDDQSLEATENVSLGPFTERLLSALMSEVKEPEADSAAETAEPENAVSAIPMPATWTPPIDDFAHLEERVKGEFRYVGVLDMGLLRKFEQNKGQYKLAKSQHHDEFTDPTAAEVDWVNGSEDDEVCRELRVIQQRLKEVSYRNTQYKQRLLPVVQEQMAWQEYSSILQDLDKQVDQAYAKRLKAPRAPPTKPKKKKSGSAVDSPASFSASDSPGRALDIAKLPDQKPAVKALLNKRGRWIQKIGPLFKEQYMMMRSHETPKFEKLADAEDEDDDLEDRD